MKYQSIEFCLDIMAADGIADEGELDVIIDKMSTKTGKKVNLDVKVDSTLLGGIKLQTENMIIDNSLQYRLNKIKESLIKV